jgi:hypothetical protein
VRPASIIDWLAIIAITQIVGFGALIAIVAVLFYQHDRSVLAELRRFIAVVDERLR